VAPICRLFPFPAPKMVHKQAATTDQDPAEQQWVQAWVGAGAGAARSRRSWQTWPQATRKHGQHVGAGKGKSRQMGATDRRRYNLLIMQLPFEQTHAPPAAASSWPSSSLSPPAPRPCCTPD